ncbi:phosphatase PAP2 family protein [Nakamurella antarctica]|uniref:Phosphatase PAP2 family protein n=1 Tax=Nakamurella antarctica TaxID=1902245 RepID=A0A3G8ZNG8_9ACTN|nr:phosphatase PAP2 family protein [Nakamurella antarctica]AZI58793.1 phosphatase PAP2 family protein [Nakamurella antarctica]
MNMIQRERPRLHHDPAYRRAGILVGVAVVPLIAFVVLATSVSVSGPTGSLDQPTLTWFVSARHDFLTVLARLISLIADPVGAALTATLFAAWLWWRRRQWVNAAYIMVTLGVAGFGIVVAKAMVSRVRPPLATQLVLETNGSFPSGHMTGAVMVYGSIALVLISSARSVRTTVLTAVVAVVAMLVVAWDRLYLGVHWLSDLAGSITLGAALLLFTTALWILSAPLLVRWQDAHPKHPAN